MQLLLIPNVVSELRFVLDLFQLKGRFELVIYHALLAYFMGFPLLLNPVLFLRLNQLAGAVLLNRLANEPFTVKVEHMLLPLD